MPKRISVAIACALAVTTAAPAIAATAAAPTTAELAARIQALEANAKQLQQEATAALAAAHEAQAALAAMQQHEQQAKVDAALAAVTNPAPPTQASGIGTGNAFNPAIAAILNGFYTHHSTATPAAPAGFPYVGEGQPLPQGLSLGESEVSMAANIDDKFYGQLTVTAESDGNHDHVGVEEAYIDTTALPAGFGVRAGRFYSNIGYLNSHHAHTDFFSVRPLAYQAFLGNQFGDDGVQVQWIAPTDTYLQLGGEAFRGERYPASGAGHGGVGAHTLFVHAGGDVGVHNAWYAGLSALRADAVDGPDGFNGTDTITIADGTWKWSRHGNFKEGGLLLRGEYLVDHRRGRYAADPLPNVPDIDPALAALAAPWTGTRRGTYLEAVYQMNRTWNFGYRWDRLWSADDGPWAADFDPWRQTAMVAWHNSEFSLLRLQFSHERPDATHHDNALTLQYQVALGAHGAHKF